VKEATLIAITGIFLACGLSGCMRYATHETGNTSKGTLTIGMSTRADVIKSWGPPRTRIASDHGEAWFYSETSIDALIVLPVVIVTGEDRGSDVYRLEFDLRGVLSKIERFS
jgi:hypothetical protein